MINFGYCCYKELHIEWQESIAIVSIKVSILSLSN